MGPCKKGCAFSIRHTTKTQENCIFAWRSFQRGGCLPNPVRIALLLRGSQLCIGSSLSRRARVQGAPASGKVPPGGLLRGAPASGKVPPGGLLRGVPHKFSSSQHLHLFQEAAIVLPKMCVNHPVNFQKRYCVQKNLILCI